MPDAVWMRPSHVRLFDHEPGPGTNLHVSGDASAEKRQVPRLTGEPHPRRLRRRLRRVQEHLHAGNSYEVNLTYRLEAESELDPVAAYLRLRELNPAPYAGFLQHDVDGARGVAAQLVSPERYALVAATRTAARIETKPIKGTTPARRDAARRTRSCAARWPPSRGSAPRT